MRICRGWPCACPVEGNHKGCPYRWCQPPEILKTQEVQSKSLRPLRLGGENSPFFSNLNLTRLKTSEPLTDQIARVISVPHDNEFITGFANIVLVDNIATVRTPGIQRLRQGTIGAVADS